MPVGNEGWCAMTVTLEEPKPITPSPMPVGSEWWGATKGAEATRLHRNLMSPMPVGSEWWGAKQHAHRKG